MPEAVHDVGILRGCGAHDWQISTAGIGEFVDAALMAPACEICIQEGGYTGLGHIDADQPFAHGNAIRIIMLSCERG
jgi:hypothetical protein